jgi:hypothetical protein
LSVVWLKVVDVEDEPAVVDVEVELTVVGAELDGATVGWALEQAAAETASPITMTCLAFINPPSSPT